MKKLDITKKQLRIIEWGVFGFFCLVGLLMPNSVEQWGIAQAYTNFLSSFVPFINNLLEHPHLPFRLAFYYSLLVIPFCFFSVFYFFVPKEMFVDIDKRQKNIKKSELLTFARYSTLLIILISFVWYVFFFGEYNGSGFSRYDFLFLTKLGSSTFGYGCFIFIFVRMFAFILLDIK